MFECSFCKCTRSGGSVDNLWIKEVTMSLTCIIKGIRCSGVRDMMTEINFVKNIVTDEEICVMILSCNDLQFDICINRADLYGEPAVGRRFKGTIWMQGYINFP